MLFYDFHVDKIVEKIACYQHFKMKNYILNKIYFSFFPHPKIKKPKFKKNIFHEIILLHHLTTEL